MFVSALGGGVGGGNGSNPLHYIFAAGADRYCNGHHPGPHFVADLKTATMTHKIPLLIDTDPGVDDALALLLSLIHI